MKTTFLLLMLLFVSIYAGPKPMEALSKYNVVLVHGASDEPNGITNCNEVGAAQDIQVSRN